MQDIMIRIQADDFEAWKEQHCLHAASRARYRITDGPAYRDLEDPGAALFHISVADMDTAMGWFRSDRRGKLVAAWLLTPRPDRVICARGMEILVGSRPVLDSAKAGDQDRWRDLYHDVIGADIIRDWNLGASQALR